jgi:hypothetical protein
VSSSAPHPVSGEVAADGRIVAEAIAEFVAVGRLNAIVCSHVPCPTVLGIGVSWAEPRGRCHVCRCAGTASLESERAHALLVPTEVVGEFVAQGARDLGP